MVRAAGIDEPEYLMGHRDGPVEVPFAVERFVVEAYPRPCRTLCPVGPPRGTTRCNPHLANGVATFPDGQIQRHKDCLIICTVEHMGGEWRQSQRTSVAYGLNG
jgi:hypothetical protein